MQTILNRGRSETNHLRELAGGNERAIRFGDHENAIVGKTADVCEGMREPNTAHGFDRMNKKPG
ncbi:hypothetical protein D3C76_1194570 [compost metagenome]